MHELAGAGRWPKARFPISAVVATLYDIGWKPLAPDAWQQPPLEDGYPVYWKIVEGGGAMSFLKTLSDSIVEGLWQHAEGHRLGQGLGHGRLPAWCQDAPQVPQGQR